MNDVQDSYEDVTDEKTEMDRRYELATVIHGMRYGGSVYTFTWPIPEETADEFMDRVTAWLMRYSDVVKKVSDTYADTHEELQHLRDQRSTVREFLGLDVLFQTRGEE